MGAVSAVLVVLITLFCKSKRIPNLQPLTNLELFKSLPLVFG